MARSDLVQVLVKAVLVVEAEVVEREGELVDTKAGKYRSAKRVMDVVHRRRRVHFRVEEGTVPDI